MGPVLVDTSLCIAALRRGRFRSALHEIAPHAPLWLSAVVLEELYAGARGPHRRIVERLEHDFAHSQRLLVPNLDDWRQTGRCSQTSPNGTDMRRSGAAASPTMR